MMGNEELQQVVALEHDHGGLHAVYVLKAWRKTHPIRWYLGGGGKYLATLESVLLELIEEGETKLAEIDKKARGESNA